MWFILGSGPGASGRSEFVQSTSDPQPVMEEVPDFFKVKVQIQDKIHISILLK